MSLFNYRGSKVLIFCFFCINSLFGFSQNIIKLSGTVIDKKTNMPIPFASITIKGNSIGTMTNSAGDFLFNFPDSLKKDSISFSAVGYETFKCLIEKNYNKKSSIHLMPHTYNLNEISI